MREREREYELVGPSKKPIFVSVPDKKSEAKGSDASGKPSPPNLPPTAAQHSPHHLGLVAPGGGAGGAVKKEPIEVGSGGGGVRGGGGGRYSPLSAGAGFAPPSLSGPHPTLERHHQHPTLQREAEQHSALLHHHGHGHAHHHRGSSAAAAGGNNAAAAMMGADVRGSPTAAAAGGLVGAGGLMDPRLQDLSNHHHHHATKFDFYRPNPELEAGGGRLAGHLC